MATPRTKNLLPALALALCNIAQAQAVDSFPKLGHFGTHSR